MSQQKVAALVVAGAALAGAAYAYYALDNDSEIKEETTEKVEGTTENVDETKDSAKENKDEMQEHNWPIWSFSNQKVWDNDKETKDEDNKKEIAKKAFGKEDGLIRMVKENLGEMKEHVK